MSRPPLLENPWYYLENFEFVLKWIVQRYSDLLLPQEQEFIHAFMQAPQASRGLLARMIMRKGSLFRASKLQYQEIGSTLLAIQALIEQQWVVDDPVLTLAELFSVLTKAEITLLFGPALATTQATTANKAIQLERLQVQFPDARRFSLWINPSAQACPVPAFADTVYREQTGEISERLRLMFFGNLHQDWSEFVLSELGLFTYEKVIFSSSSRAFQTREDIDTYLHLHRCKEQLTTSIAAGNTVELTDIRHAIGPRHDSEWLEARRSKLLFKLGQHHERLGMWPEALSCYQDGCYPGARARSVRVLERANHFDDALLLAQAALQSPENEAEHQTLLRMMPRLLRRTGAPAIARRTASEVPKIHLSLPTSAARRRVEEQVRQYLDHAQAPVFYVENTLINALFGLLCWDAIFTAIPGAFFHPFQQGPADLLHANFQARRQPQLDACLAQLNSQQYKQTILENFSRKSGIQSAFVAWGYISAEILNTALACMPAQHLKITFARLMQDLRSNRSGLPDLIQFWPVEQRYRMIEVKGPGDRLQDNQIRWLDYCHAHHIPVAVCYVQHQLPAEA